MKRFLGFALTVGLAAASAGVAQQAAFSAADASAASYSSSASEAAIMAAPKPLPSKDNADETRWPRAFSRIAFGTKMGTLGWGGQIATPLLPHLNLRGGADFFNFGYGLASDGANYNGEMHLKSGQIGVDYYPFRRASFHISPSVLILKPTIAASMYVPGGNSFTLGGTDYMSDPNDPVQGTGRIVPSRSAMPALTVGFGNMITRRSRHWSTPIDVGAAYMGVSTAQLSLVGSACQQGYCMSVSDPEIQASVQTQQAKFNESAKKYQIFPILTTGVAYRF